MNHRPHTTATAALPATRVRYRVVVLAVLLAMITYLDRVAISKLAPDIMRDLQDLPLQLLALLFLAGAGCWLLIDPRRPIFAADAAR